MDDVQPGPAFFLAQLPFRELSTTDLEGVDSTVPNTARDAIKALVCRTCWNEIFSSEAFAQCCWGLKEHPNNDFSYRARLRRLRKAARRGCNWCQLVLDIPGDEDWTLARASGGTSVNVRFNLDSPRTPTTPPGFHVFTLWIGSSLGDLSAFADQNDPAAAFVTARRLQTVVDSDEAFNQAKSLIKSCKYHEKCPEPQKATLPTRVIEVCPELDPSSPRLLESKGMIGSYAALSYCWGQAQQPGITTMDSLPGRLERLELPELSQTVRDAIHCVRNLGIRYLWVDAICIVQDSPEDMTRELASMRRVYENARITIAAASSDNATKGFLQDRPRPPPSYRVPFPCPNKKMGSVYMTHGGRGLGMRPSSYDPLHTRAWTLQESLLSSRLLLYSSHTLQFRCRTGTFNIGGSLHTDYHQPLYLSPTLHQPPRRRLELSAERVREVLDEWESVTTEFTSCSLGFSGDKLPALAGIAERFSYMLRTPYAGGLWEASLARLFQWRTNSDSRKPRPSEYRAPSWSWTSVDGTVWYNSSGDAVPFRFRIVECKLKLLSDTNPFGAVTSGHLQVKGPIRKAWFNPPGKITWGKPDAAASGRASEASEEEETPVRRRDYDLYAAPDTSDDATRPPGWVYCFGTVLRFYRQQKLREHGPDVWVDGMVLVPIDESRLLFRRIAHFAGGKKADFVRAPRRTVIIE